MATSYIVCISIRHPFTDGNKRVALASSLTFLLINGYELIEEYEHEFADLILDFLSQKIDKHGITNILRSRVKK